MSKTDKRINITMWLFLAFISYFLITEHWAHIVPYLPWLILLACPFMHLFMHGGHGQDTGQGGHGNQSSPENHTHHQEK